MRLNPAEEDYQLNKLYSRIGLTFQTVKRTEADTHSPGVTEPPVVPPTADTFQIDPSNPHLVIYTSASITGNEHSVDIPISTLLTPDPSNPHLAILPTL